MSTVTRFGSAAVGASPAPESTPLPSPEPAASGGRRRRRLVAVGVLVVVALLAGLAAGRLWAAQGRVPVWMLVRDVPSGLAVSADDVRRVEIDRAPDAAVTGDAPPAGLVTTTPLHAGAVLRTPDVGTGPTVPAAGQALVGLAAVPGRVPDGLRSGDHVELVSLPAESAGARSAAAKPQVLAKSVVVQHVVVTTQGTTVTLVVSLHLAPTVAALSSADRLALVGLPAP